MRIELLGAEHYKLSAHRYLFGPYSPSYTAEASYLAEAWLPLPLSWNGQDRV